MGGIAIESVVKQAGIAPSDVNEVYMGNVCAAGLGQAPARQAAIFGGNLNSLQRINNVINGKHFHRTTNKYCMHHHQ